MEFTQNFQGVTSAVYSPDSQLIAFTNGSTILVKSSQDMSLIQKFDHKDIITQMLFSPDSSLLLVVQSKSSIATVYQIQDGKKVVNIVDQSAGLLHATWSPDSRSLITFSDFQLKASIFSLVTQQKYQIKNPKYHNKGISFSNDGKFMALAERKNAKDHIGIYFTSDWKLINQFAVDTSDLNDISWSEDNSYIIVWDSNLSYRLLAYCPVQGRKACISPYEYALGIKSVASSKDSAFVAVGSYDEKVRLINTLTWQIITELDHKPNLKQYNYSPIIYNEQQKTQYTNISERNTHHYEIVENCKIAQLRVNTQLPDQPQGIENIIWSFDNSMIATQSSNMPNTVWIWDIATLQLKAVLNHINPVKSCQWSKNTNHLVISTGKNRVFFFSPDGASVCDLPFEGKLFQVNQVLWSNDSTSMVMLDRNDAVVAYPPRIFLPNLETNDNQNQNEEEVEVNNNTNSNNNINYNDNTQQQYQQYQ